MAQRQQAIPKVILLGYGEGRIQIEVCLQAQFTTFPNHLLSEAYHKHVVNNTASGMLFAS